MDLILKNTTPGNEGSYYLLWNKKVFNGVKIPFINKAKRDIGYGTYNLIEYTNIFGQKEYELIDEVENRHKIVFMKDRVIIDNGKIQIFIYNETKEDGTKESWTIYKYDRRDFISISNKGNKAFFRRCNDDQSFVDFNFSRLTSSEWTFTLETHCDRKKQKIKEIRPDGSVKFEVFYDETRQKTKGVEYRSDGSVDFEIFYDKTGQKTKEIVYRTDGSVKYIDNGVGTAEQTYTLYFQGGATPILIQQHGDYRFISPKTKEGFVLTPTKTGYQIPVDRELGRQIIDDIFEEFMKKFNPLTDNLGQNMANAYLMTHCDPNTIFINFDNKATQAKTLKEFQTRYFVEGDKAEFKVGIIGNEKHDHSMCLVIPNPILHPEAKAFLFDSSFARIKIKDGLFTDVNSDLAKDVLLLNSCQMQHGNSCTFFAMLAAEELSKKSFAEIQALHKHIQALHEHSLRLTRVANDFELELSELLKEKFPLQVDCKSEHGCDYSSTDFDKAVKARIELELSKSDDGCGYSSVAFVKFVKARILEQLLNEKCPLQAPCKSKDGRDHIPTDFRKYIEARRRMVNGQKGLVIGS